MISFRLHIYRHREFFEATKSFRELGTSSDFCGSCRYWKNKVETNKVGTGESGGSVWEAVKLETEDMRTRIGK